MSLIRYIPSFAIYIFFFTIYIPPPPLDRNRLIRRLYLSNVKGRYKPFTSIIYQLSRYRPSTLTIEPDYA